MSELEKPEFANETDQKVWQELRHAVSSYGEYADSETEFGLVRKAKIEFLELDAVLRIAERMDPRDLDGPLAYQVDRHDWRGDYDFMVSRTSDIGYAAARAVLWDLEIYRGETGESMESRRYHDRMSLRAMDAMRRQEHGKKIADWPEESAQEIQDRALIHGMSPADKKRLAIQLARPEAERAKPRRKMARGVLRQPPGYGFGALNLGRSNTLVESQTLDGSEINAAFKKMFENDTGRNIQIEVGRK